MAILTLSKHRLPKQFKVRFPYFPVQLLQILCLNLIKIICILWQISHEIVEYQDLYRNKDDLKHQQQTVLNFDLKDFMFFKQLM